MKNFLLPESITRVFISFLLLVMLSLSINTYGQELEPECTDDCQTLCDLHESSSFPIVWSGGNITSGITSVAAPAMIQVTGNVNLSGSTALVFKNCIFKVSPGVQFNVVSKTTFEDCLFFSCEQMWKGIVVGNSKDLTLTNCQVEDAQYAVNADVFSKIWLTDNRFNRNYISLYINPSVVISPGDIPPKPPYINAFSGNEFTCCAPLNAPYTGQTPSPGTWSRTGVYSYYGSNSFGVGALKVNTFRCMLQGAELANGYFVMHNCRFRYMRQSPTAVPIYREKTGLVVRFGSLDFKGLGNGLFITDYTFFSNPRYALYTEDSYINVSESIFEGNAYGIVSTGNIDGDCLIKNNTFNDFGNSSSFGIAIDDYISDYKIRIEDNVFNNIMSKSIEMTSTDHDNSFIIYRNFFIQNNNSQDYNFIHKAYGASNQNLQIIENSFDDNTNKIFGGLVYLDANLSGSSNKIENNTFSGITNISDPSEDKSAIKVFNFNNGYFCQNTLDNIPKGISFYNACPGLELRHTSFGRHYRGLYCKDAIFPTQTDYGNTWMSSGSYTDNGAYYDGLGFLLAQFFVNVSTSYYPSSLYPGSGWFQSSSNSVLYCKLSDPQLVDTGISEEQRIWIENSQTELAGSDKVRNWYLLRSTYADIADHLQWKEGDNMLTEFYESNEYTDIGILDRYRREFNACLLPNEDEDLQLGMWNEQIEQFKMELVEIDGLIANGNYSDDIQAQKEAIIGSLDALYQSKVGLHEDISQQSKPRLLTLIDVNNTLSDDRLVSYEKALNNILLNRLLEGRNTYNDQEEETIEYIAGLCYEEAGISPSRAISMLTDEQKKIDYLIHYNHNCEQTSGRVLKNTPIVDESAIIYPNPASLYIFIKVKNDQYTNLKNIMIKNTLGEVVLFQNKFKFDGNSEKINIYGLSPGIYFVWLEYETGQACVNKLIVN